MKKPIPGEIPGFVLQSLAGKIVKVYGESLVLAKERFVLLILLGKDADIRGISFLKIIKMKNLNKKQELLLEVLFIL